MPKIAWIRKEHGHPTMASGFRKQKKPLASPNCVMSVMDILDYSQRTCDVTMLFVLKIQELRSKLVSNMGLSHSGRLSFSPLLAKSGDFGSIPQVHMAQHVVSRDFVKKKELRVRLCFKQ